MHFCVWGGGSDFLNSDFGLATEKIDNKRPVFFYGKLQKREDGRCTH